MAWINFDNGDTGLSIRSALNTFLTTVSDFLDGNNQYTDTEQAKVTANVAGVAQNAADITDVEADVAQNISDIATVDAKVDTNAPFIPFFAYSVNTPTPLNTTTWTQTNRVVDATAEAGTYSFAHTVIHSYSSTTRSAYCRLSYDGGVNWVEFRHEPKDSTDAYPTSCSRPFVVGVGEGIDIIVQHKCESASDTLTVTLTSLMVERKV